MKRSSASSTHCDRAGRPGSMQQSENELRRLSGSAAPGATSQGLRLGVIVCSVFMMFLVCNAYAAGGELDGGNLYIQVKNFFFGNWGLVIGVILLVAAVIAWGRFGMAEGIMFIVLAFIFFLIPGGSVALQNVGKSIAGG